MFRSAVALWRFLIPLRAQRTVYNAEPGDPDREQTYAAVGYALSQWELLEAQLCNLLGAFCGLPYASSEAIEEYSREQRIFFQRLQRLDQKKAVYFNYNHSQELEGEYDRISVLISELSEKRSNIAHGAVQEYEVKEYEQTLSYSYALFPVFYNAREQVFSSDQRHLNFSPSYVYSSSLIRSYGDEFRTVTRRVFEFRIRIEDEISSLRHRPICQDDGGSVVHARGHLNPARTRCDHHLGQQNAIGHTRNRMRHRADVLVSAEGGQLRLRALVKHLKFR